MTRSTWLAGAVFAGLFVALHLPFLPSSLEDLDSINFALGIRDFDVSRHQPHPPGYPLFIALAKTFHATGLSELRALSLVSVLAGALGVLALLTLFDALDRQRPAGGAGAGGLDAWIAPLFVTITPLYWLTSARPLSDMAGLTAAVAVQALTIGARRPQSLMMAAGLAGLAAGIRSQVVWLTVPLLMLAARRLPAGTRSRATVRALGAYLVGMLLWAVPLLVVSGGPAAYARAIFDQGAEDLSGVSLLATMPSVRLLAHTLEHSFLDPWGPWLLAGAVLAFAIVGGAALVRRAPRVALTLAVAFGPYLAFHLLFQEAVTTRYALPLVVPAVYLAVRGATMLPRPLALVIGLAVAAQSILVNDRALSGYSQMDAPAFRLIGDMRTTPRRADSAPVLAVHRREAFDLRRPFVWAGDTLPPFDRRLAAPPKHEWLELVKYWNAGGRAPVWFVADPLRTDLALVRYSGRPTFYRWPFPYTALIGGVRPNEMDWHAIEAPDWYLAEGWSLTPETAGTAREDGRGAGHGGISGWIRRRAEPLTLMIGGRNLSTTGAAARLRVAIDGQPVDDVSVAPGFFLRMLRTQPPAGAGDYVHLTVESDNPDLAVEQFDAQPAGRVVYGFGDGWNEMELDPVTGAMWRWSSDRAVIRARAEGHALALNLRGEIEAAGSSHVVVRAGDQVAAEVDVGRSFTQTVLIPSRLLQGDESRITIETSAWYVPADKGWRSGDRRRLGLKLSECRLTPAS